jgi:outer membrane immunogenic protein
MNRLATAIAAIALIGTPAFAADMAVKAPPTAPAPVPYTWTGFYGGIEFGGGWSDEAVNYSPNDPLAAALLNGKIGVPGNQPVASGYRISQSSAVGGFEAGYNWQAGSNWLLGLETDFSFSGMSGRASSPSSVLQVFPGPITSTQSTTTERTTDWYGTARGRAGWLATPNLLLFGTGGFAYGRTSASATYMTSVGSLSISGPISFSCTAGVPCFVGSASTIRTGWTAGGGAEWLLDQHWSAKIEYQFVDLGTETVRVTAVAVVLPGQAPASFNAIFHDRFNVVRLGLNYRF